MTHHIYFENILDVSVEKDEVVLLLDGHAEKGVLDILTFPQITGTEIRFIPKILADLRNYTNHSKN